MCPEWPIWILGPDRDASLEFFMLHKSPPGRLSPWDGSQAQVTQPTSGALKGRGRVIPFWLPWSALPGCELGKEVHEISECKETWGRWPGPPAPPQVAACLIVPDWCLE